MSKTVENLKEAFAGESQANRRYLAYAKQAEKEGLPYVAKLFRAVAAAETIHAHNHLRALGEINDTAQNLKEAMAGENYEAISMYPPMVADAEAEGEKKALASLKWAWDVEKEHEILFKEALANLGGAAQEVDIWVCPVCGSTHVGMRPEKCPVCGAPGARFECIQ